MDTINWMKVAAHVSAGLCMGIGALGPSLGQGYVGGKACESISRNPESSKTEQYLEIAPLQSNQLLIQNPRDKSENLPQETPLPEIFY